MEETREAMTTEEQATEPAETGTNQPQAPEAEHEEKTFTQDEVNEIVRRRLAKEREKFTSLMDGEGENKLIEREKAVLKRELRADALDKLKEKQYPSSLADLLDYTDEESCNASFDKVIGVFQDLKKQAFEAAFKSGAHTPRAGGIAPVNNIREAFRPKI